MKLMDSRMLRALPVWNATSILLVVAAVLAGGCGGNAVPEPAVLKLDPHASGNSQCGLYGQPLTRPLRVLVEGPLVRGILGGEGSRRPVKGTPVTFTVEDSETGAVFSENGETAVVRETDSGGMAQAQLVLGSVPGDVYVTASILEGREKVRFRATAGVELIGSELEGPTEGVIDEFGVRLSDADGRPVPGVAVHFRVEGNGNGSSVGSTLVETGDDGRAVTSWKLGKKVQQYFVSVEVEDRRSGVPENGRFAVRPVEFKAMATNKMLMVMELLGGLAVFIFGMKLMSEGLQRMADRRLKAILQTVTRNRLLAVLVGAGLTAVIQSSSATTVMTVGFVNAGLVSLSQAIGVELGATIGTTITAQIIAFKLNVLAYPSIMVGLILAGLGRRPPVKALGTAILGFGLLFLGMTTMSDILKPLRHSPEFVALFHSFDCTPAPGEGIPPGAALMCIVIGTATTVIVQSSSATVGLVLALASQGLVSFYTAVPLILGDNIGTTVTAVLASLGANRDAKRTALAHTLYKVLGASYMYVLLFVPLWNGQPVFLGFVDAITPGDAFGETPENLLRHVANSHTAFNVFNCLVFLPFIPLMARLCRKIIPVTDADRETVLEYLEPNLLATPSLALQQAVVEVAYMLRRAQKSLNESCEFFFDGPRDLETNVLKREKRIDRLQHEITSYLVELSRQQLPAREAALIPLLIHAVNDAERVGDRSEDLLEATHLRRDHNRMLCGPAQETLREALALLNAQFDDIFLILRKSDLTAAERVLAREEEMNRLSKEGGEAHVGRLERGEAEVQAGVIFLDVLGHLERVGDHLANVAERAGIIVSATSG